MLSVTAIVDCRGGNSAAERDRTVQELMSTVRALAHDSLEGRRTGTPGNESARRFLETRFAAAGVRPFGRGFRQPFGIEPGDSDSSAGGANVVGMVSGRDPSRGYIVVTAHFDHLGVRGGQVFNGADDNASGTAVLLALAGRIAEQPLRHGVVFAALDGEELGLLGARAFIGALPVPTDDVVVNLNLDMVGHSDSVLFVAGTYQNPELRPLVGAVQPGPGLVVRFGHDDPHLPVEENWVGASDHAVFHDRGIPFLYFGVEDHPDYHQPTDDVERLNPAFLRAVFQFVWDTMVALDRAI